MLIFCTLLVLYCFNQIELSRSILRIHRGRIIPTDHVQRYSHTTLLGCASLCRKSMFCAGANFRDGGECFIVDRLSIDRNTMAKDINHSVIIFQADTLKSVSAYNNKI